MSVQIIQGDSREQLPLLAADSIDAVITDPPYALVSITKRWSGDGPPPREGVYRRSTAGFMGKAWDTGETAFDPAFWSEVLRVMKPGAHLIAFGGTRTYHRLVCAIEDAGFEIRDQLAWLFGSGFPKSHDVSKGIDKAAGAEREVVGEIPDRWTGAGGVLNFATDRAQDTVKVRSGAATPEAAQWQGWGSALKPAHEPIVLARKPLGSPAIDVRGIVEQQLRERGVDGEIRWTKESASGAAKRETLRTSSLTAAPPAAETFAAHAAENATRKDDQQTENLSGLRTLNGERQIARTSEQSNDSATSASDSLFLPRTETNARVAGKRKNGSSRLTTSTVAEARTEEKFTAKSTTNCGERGIPPDTESFAGIATGLSGLMERVLIKRLGSQSFAWPDDLPEYVPSRSLTIAANVLKHGTGALNIDACRVEAATGDEPMTADRVAGNRSRENYRTGVPINQRPSDLGRWPANVIHDGSPEVLAGFPDAPGQGGSVSGGEQSSLIKNAYGARARIPSANPRTDEGSAARFFYTPKADKADRCLSKHPTVKPIDLMAYLIKLVTPPGGTVLDPFAGSGSTGMAAMREGFNAILIEREAEYVRDIQRRLDHVHGHDTPLFAEIAS